MKKYVFFNPLMSGMGGGQMYVYNKINYLQKNGWKVDLIYSTPGKIFIKDLQKYDYKCPEFFFPTYYFTKNRINKVINLLVSRINDAKYDEIVIESTYIFTATWGEAVAAKIKAKHIINLLQEQNEIVNKSLQQFYIYKYQRRELVSITDTSLQQMFASFSPIAKEKSYWLPAWCNNVEADVYSPWIGAIDKSKYDFVVGCLSRLEKPFIIPSITDICNYATLHLDKKFLLLLMGGSTNNEVIIPQIKELVSHFASNVDVIITGYLFPVPIRLLEMCDVLYSSAGSSGVCKRSGIPTITYDSNDCRPIGIYGRTTDSSVFRKKDELEIKAQELLDQILIKQAYPKLPSSYNNDAPDFKEHIEFLALTSQVNEYYNLEKLHVESLTEIKVYLGIMIIGAAKYHHLSQKKMK